MANNNNNIRYTVDTVYIYIIYLFIFEIEILTLPRQHVITILFRCSTREIIIIKQYRTSKSEVIVNISMAVFHRT